MDNPSPDCSSVVVTGAAGMLGSVVAQRFESAGWSTTRLVRPPEVSSLSSNRQTDVEGHFAYADLSDAASLSYAIENIEADLCIHCAALTNLKTCENDPDLATRVHIDATRQLAHSSSFKRMIYISTDSVFDGQVGGYDESASCRPLNVYAETKRRGEDAALEHPDAIVLRTNLFDVRRPPQASLAEWGYRSLANGETISGYTNLFFNPLHVDQIASVLLAVSEKCVWQHDVVHVGSDQTVSKFEFLKMIAKTLDLDQNLIQPAAFQSTDQDLLKRPLNTSLNIDRLRRWLPDADLSLSTGIMNLRKSVVTR